MSSPITLSGFNNIDFSQVLNALMAQERIPVTQLTTQQTALSNQKVNLYSDLLLHDMGNGLSDGVSQGEAGPREFRTAPLWGLGQRLFFLHDGRASDLIATVRAHASSGSEANGVVARFLGLSETQKQNLLNFLRSL